jgi:hypothetical protein
MGCDTGSDPQDALDASGFEDFIYAGQPDPPLSSKDAAGARTFVPS